MERLIKKYCISWFLMVGLMALLPLSGIAEDKKPVNLPEALIGLWAQSSGVPLFASIDQPAEGLWFEKDGEITVLVGKILFTRGKYSVTPGKKLRVDGFPGGTQFGPTAEFEVSLSGDSLILKRGTAQATYRKTSWGK
jgi:hypothetical protein